MKGSGSRAISVIKPNEAIHFILIFFFFMIANLVTRIAKIALDEILEARLMTT